MVRATVAIAGLSEFQRALRKLDGNAPKALRVAFNESADLLVDLTVPKIPRRTGRAAQSLKARSTRTAARVGVGGNRAPYYPWLDFGGRTGRNRTAKRDFYPEGRYLYPTLAEHRDKFTAKLEAALIAVAEDAGLGVD